MMLSWLDYIPALQRHLCILGHICKLNCHLGFVLLFSDLAHLVSLLSLQYVFWVR